MAVVVGVAGPVIGQARGRAEISGCQSNLRQLAEGMHVYAGASEGWFPVVSATSARGYNVRVAGDVPGKGEGFSDNNVLAAEWLLVGQGMVKDTKMYICPSDPFAGANAGGGAAAVQDSAGKAYGCFGSGKQVSYSMRYPWAESAEKRVVAGGWWRARQEGDAQDEPVMMDMAPYMGTKAGAGEAYPTGPAATQAAGGALVVGGGDEGPVENSPNHVGTVAGSGENVLCLDGHVEWCGEPRMGRGGDNFWSERVGGKEEVVEAGEIPAALAEGKGALDVVMVPMRSAKGELK
ncbi:MAG TPA: hypothetical protein VHQ47_15050 [Phycisphaerae bacterium]|nr:hypothetical protein [Phycisphaerae bacterium]